VGERAADDLDPRRHALDGVVRAGEQSLVAGGGEILPGRAELGRPEEVEVRLVADDHVPQAGDPLDDAGEPRRKAHLLNGRPRRLRAVGRVGVEVDVAAGGAGQVDPVPQVGEQSRVDRSLAPLPGDRHPSRITEVRALHQRDRRFLEFRVEELRHDRPDLERRAGHRRRAGGGRRRRGRTRSTGDGERRREEDDASSHGAR
jgi:hypothetical protein